MPLLTGRGSLFGGDAVEPILQVNYCVMGNNSGRPHSLGGWVQVTRAEEGVLDVHLDTDLALVLQDGRRVELHLMRRRPDRTSYDFTGNFSSKQ